ncbi:MAG: hypothetical protein LBG64_01870 [Pseudomonadales bacterium]|jgi:hypothetical protein|nr:hypothetical protein [Pseudomonadales bacterium]
MDHKLTDEQKQRIKAFADSLTQNMSQEIEAFIENELSQSANNNVSTSDFHQAAVNADLSDGGMIENVGDEAVVQQQAHDDFAQMTPATPEVVEQTIDYSMPTPSESDEVSVDHGVVLQPVPPIDMTDSVPAPEVPAVNADVNAFGSSENGVADMSNLDGSDLNYVEDAAPVVVGEDSHQVENPFTDDSAVQSVEVATPLNTDSVESTSPEASPAADVTNVETPISPIEPIVSPEFSAADVASTNVETTIEVPEAQANVVEISETPTAEEVAPADEPKEAFPQAHGILNKVLSKGWGGKKNDSNAG